MLAVTEALSNSMYCKFEPSGWQLVQYGNCNHCKFLLNLFYCEYSGGHFFWNRACPFNWRIWGAQRSAGNQPRKVRASVPEIEHMQILPSVCKRLRVDRVSELVCNISDRIPTTDQWFASGWTDKEEELSHLAPQNYAFALRIEIPRYGFTCFSTEVTERQCDILFKLLRSE